MMSAVSAIFLVLLSTSVFCKVDKLETSKEIFFEEQTHIKPYDLATPILYTFSLQSTDDIISNLYSLFQTNKNETFGNYFFSTLQNIVSSRDNLIKDFRMQSKHRSKRGIMTIINPIRDFFGDALILCCRALTYRQGHKMVANEISLAKSYSILKDTLKEDHKNLFVINDVINKMNEHLQWESVKLKQVVQKLNWEISSAVQKTDFMKLKNDLIHHQIIQNSINLLQLELFNLGHLMTSCKIHRLSQNFVNMTTLQSDLRKIEITAWNNNLELVLDSVSEIETYFHLDILNCNIFENNIELEVKVPLRKKGTKPQLFKIKPLKFFDSGKICNLDLNIKSIISDKKRSEVKSVLLEDEGTCPLEGPLCLIPQSRTLNTFDSCVTSIFKKEAQNEIVQKCRFKCEKANEKEVIATHLEQNKFLITNFNTLIAINLDSGEKKSINFDKNHSGAYIFEVPCDTEIINLNKLGTSSIIISAGIPCFDKLIQPIVVRKIIPFTWLKLSEPDNMNYENIDKSNITIDDFNIFWNSSNYVLNDIESPENFSKKLGDLKLAYINLEEQGNFTMINFFILIWLGCLTFLVLVLIYCVWNKTKILPFELGENINLRDLLNRFDLGQNIPDNGQRERQIN